MRYDDQPGSSPIPSATSDLRPASRARAWAWPAVLVVLTVATSLAVAFTVSLWLVPPYLVLMAWILAPAPGSRSPAGDVSRPEPREAQVDCRPAAEPAGEGSSPADPDGSSPLGSDPAPDPEPVTVKTRRGKGRGRKARAAGGAGAIVEPGGSTATWVRVGPGKFVRAEGPTPGTPAGIVPATPEGEREPADSPAPTSSAVEESADPTAWELAPESTPATEDRPAILEDPEPRDEPVLGEPIADELTPPCDDEACPRPASVEASSPDLDRTPALESHQDEICADVDVGASEESPSLDERKAIDDVGDGDGDGDDHAEVMAESLPAASEWDDPMESGPDVATGDQGIALDALDACRTAEPSEDHSPDEAAADFSERALASVAPSRSTDQDAPSVSWRASWPRVERVACSSSASPAGPRLGRAGRGVRERRVAPGFRRRSRRGAGRYRLVCRTFPPRSPPRSGRVTFVSCNETGGGGQGSRSIAPSEAPGPASRIVSRPENSCLPSPVSPAVPS